MSPGSTKCANINVETELNRSTPIDIDIDLGGLEDRLVSIFAQFKTFASNRFFDFAMLRFQDFISVEAISLCRLGRTSFIFGLLIIERSKKEFGAWWGHPYELKVIYNVSILSTKSILYFLVTF